MSKILSIAGFLILCYAVAAFGAQFTPGDWYQGLQRAPWNPPNIVFPIVWTILYAMIAVAGWSIFSQTENSLKMLWIIQLILNGLWSWLFFGLHAPMLALLDIIALLITLLFLVRLCFLLKARFAAWLLVPYVLWIVLATSLNAYIVIYN